MARARLTSAVELYDASGQLVSRFALNFPEYTGTIPAALATSSCDWETFGEAAPFGHGDDFHLGVAGQALTMDSRRTDDPRKAVS